jgi:hypothetical protein
MPSIDVYRLSRLAFAQVTGWRRILQELREDYKYAFKGYLPFRKAAVALLRLGDRNSDASILRQIRRESGGAESLWTPRNERAYQVFKERFAPDLAGVDEVFMGRWAEEPALSFAGDVELTGGPHFSATDKRGALRFVYLHPSVRWSAKETDAFCELLCYVARHRWDADPSQMWFLDTARSQRYAYRPRKRVLARCKEAAELLFGTELTREL